MKLGGYLPDPADSRDLLLGSSDGFKFPASVDLRKSGFLPRAKDQLSTSSCVAQAIAAGLTYLENRDKEVDGVERSRLFIYWNARKLRGWEKEDSGCHIRDALKTINNIGACSEKLWSFRQCRVNKTPSSSAFKDAPAHKLTAYRRIADNDINALKLALASGYPCVLGVYMDGQANSDSVSAEGMIPIPKTLDYGHAILIVGYDENGWIFLNSWGVKWGVNGYGYLPKEYLTTPGLSDDWWILTDF